jgi:hypothetical protein
LAEAKKNFKFEYNPETQTINVISKFNAPEEEINKSVVTFEKTLEKKILHFLDEFTKLKFYIKGNLNSDLFFGHANIKIEDADQGVQFSRNQGDSSFNYFCCLMKEPLLDKCIYKVNVLAVYDSDRFVDVGIMAKSKWESTQNGWLNSWSSGGISYCGYSHCGGLNGNYPTTSASDGSGLKPGDHFYLDYEPGKAITYYNDAKTINLTMDMTGKNEEYYLFTVVYHP